MRISLKRKKPRNKSTQIRVSRRQIYSLFVATMFAVLWVNLGSMTKFGLQINLSESYIPTLINGITTSTSIVIGILIAVLGIMLRFSVESKDSVSKNFYLVAMVILIMPIVLFWSTYTFLTMGLYAFAVRYALSTLIIALLICVLVVVFAVVRMANQSEKEDPTIGDDF